MGKRVKIQTDYTAEEFHERYQHAQDPVERTHWHMLWLAKEGKTPQVIAELLGYTARWVRTVIGRWNGPKVAGWMQQRLGRKVAPQRGWEYLRQLGHSSRVPRPQHGKADEATQQEFKKTAGTSGPSAAPAPPSQRRALDAG